MIKFLKDENYKGIDQAEAKYIISIIGEPIVKRKLQKMYDERFLVDKAINAEEVKSCRDRVQKLRVEMQNKEKIDHSTLDQLDNILQKLSQIVIDNMK